MDVFAVFQLLGGVAMFLFGMNVMGSGLEKVSGSKLEHTMEKMTNNKMKGVGLGFVVTAMLQSSSATTVMLVGFVNAGVMSLYQATNVIMGANIGTTVTGWITALSGVDGELFILQLLKPANFAPLVAVAGIIMLMACKGRKKDVGGIFLGFSVLMTGMTIMASSVEPLSEDPNFQKILLAFNNPLLGLLCGAVLTGIIQSSAASVGILQALAHTSGMTYNMAIPIIMGQNIGTCVTALISCVGANKNAKRTAMVHLYFNVIGSALFISLYYAFRAIAPGWFAFADTTLTTFGIALIHTIFNILSTAVLLPLSKQLCKLAEWTIRDKKEPAKNELSLLDERFLNSPSFAVEQCRTVIHSMSTLAKDAMTESIHSLEHLDNKLAESIREKEEMLDRYEDRLGSYLVALSSRELTESENRDISQILHSISDFERIGDHALNILGAAEEMKDKNIRFSDQATAEIRVLTAALNEIMEMTVKAFNEDDYELAKRVEPLEQVVDDLKEEIRNRHINRLQEGSCTIELGFILNDILTNIERVSDHCSNLAASMIELHHKTYEMHTYLNLLKSSGLEEFEREYEDFARQYPLPEQPVKK